MIVRKQHSSAVIEHEAVHARRVGEPRGDVFTPPAPERWLPVWQGSLCGQQFRPGWFFVGAHGGAGTTLLSRITWEEQCFQTSMCQIEDPPSFGFDAGRAFPNPAEEPTDSVVVVCRTTMAGLARARDVAGQYLAGAVPVGLRILGLITIADQPGRLPRELAAARSVLAGAYAHTWLVPFVPAYRMFSGLPTDLLPATHPALGDALAAIRSLINPKGQL